MHHHHKSSHNIFKPVEHHHNIYRPVHHNAVHHPVQIHHPLKPHHPIQIHHPQIHHPAQIHRPAQIHHHTHPIKHNIFQPLHHNIIHHNTVHHNNQPPTNKTVETINSVFSKGEPLIATVDKIISPDENYLLYIGAGILVALYLTTKK